MQIFPLRRMGAEHAVREVRRVHREAGMADVRVHLRGGWAGMQKLQMEMGNGTMKLSKISQICKRHPYLRVFRTDQAQWVSIGAAAYPVYGLPAIEEWEAKAEQERLV